MIELTIRKAGEADHKVLLKGGVYGIGRHADNEIVLDDREVSRRHARLLVDRDSVVVEDLGGGNGTYVDGAPVTDRPLRHGDRIEILPFTLQVKIATAPERRVSTLVATAGADVGRRFTLAGDTVGLGRGDDQDVRLDDAGASRAHALLVQRKGTWFVRDLDSANGTFVNGQRVAEAPIEAGDVIEIGTTSLRFDVVVEGGRAAVEVDLDDDGAPTDVGDDGPSTRTAPRRAPPRPAAPYVQAPAPPPAALPEIAAPAVVASAPVAVGAAAADEDGDVPYYLLIVLAIFAVSLLGAALWVASR